MNERPLESHSKTLGELRQFLDLPLTLGDKDLNLSFHGLTLSSQKLKTGDLFIALQGERSHGADHFTSELTGKIAAILTDRIGAGKLNVAVPVIVADNLRSRVGDIAEWFYNRPFSYIYTVGITGTNGKTTTAALLNQLWKMAGKSTGCIGTVGIEVANEYLPASLTTPEATDLHSLGAIMKERHVTHAVMEVSSHSLVQKRVSGIDFDVVAFTNLTQDHLDFHKDMESYFQAKATLFTNEYAELGIVNIDGDYGFRLYESASIPMVSVSRSNRKAQWHYTRAEAIHGGYEVAIRGTGGILIEGTLNLIGGHNLDNTLLAVAIAVESGVDPLVISSHLSKLTAPAGRLEKVDVGQKFLALVDYAHSPDAVERVLATVRNVTPGRIIAVLGCGGDRDASKRALMGNALISGSDFAVMTSDNPRSEDPEEILESMRGAHVESSTLIVEKDRRGAIAIAVSEAQAGDTVILLGKGHETGQEILGVKHPFDDCIELARAIESLG